VTLGWKVIARAARGAGAPGELPLDPFSRLLLIALAALMLLATPLRATEPDWPDDPYTIDIVEQDLIEVLRDFAGTLGISVRISEAVTGTVRGRLPSLPPREFLDLLARIYGLVWYYDGATLYVYGSRR
jgi:type III secretion protein C